jgi:hypothetical protein
MEAQKSISKRQKKECRIQNIESIQLAGDPGGIPGNSPAIYRWVELDKTSKVPSGTAEEYQPSLRD